MKIQYIIPALFLTGCASNTTIGSVTLGECQIVHTPTYEVLGKTAYDRRWVVTTEESLVRGCNQPRPLKRPASFDAKPKPKPVVSKPTAVVPVQPAKPKKKHWWNRQ